MILLELAPNEVFQLVGNERHIYSVFGENTNGTIRVRKVAVADKDRRFYMLPELEISNMSKFTEVQKIMK